ncbi:NAD-dependent epimerase/dehydratase family protein [Plantactinospora sp. B6F1]|uniref:NAD-dependent epimerase/dehydratase family protein n=1 Tax=Plantactinospora sp. B6F1 TaxID=3158971 RepID=UPI0032D92A08
MRVLFTIMPAVATVPRRPRLIRLGSVHEYGPVPIGAAITEGRLPAPNTGYGRSKLGGTRAVLRAVRTGGLDGLVLRIANVCGPGAPPASLLGSVAGQLAGIAATGAGELRLGPLFGRRDLHRGLLFVATGRSMRVTRPMRSWRRRGHRDRRSPGRSSTSGGARRSRYGGWSTG